MSTATLEIVEWGGDRPLAGRVRSIEPSAFTRVSALGVDEQRVNVIVDLLDRRVEIGHRAGASVEISSGLKAGERVVLFPSDKVDDGSRVR